MESSELELFTTQELIDELTRRTTFLGVVVHASAGMKNREWGGDQVFKVRFNTNLSAAEVGRLLDTVARGLDNSLSECD